MKVVGIIVEYNPLHNGHIHHINETKRISNCDILVAVISGNYVQRGAPSTIDKFTKTQLALESGIDLVVELPFVYSTQSAELFAFGAVSILNELGVCEIYFGSESNDISKLNIISNALNTISIKESIKLNLKKGLSYPKCLSLAVGENYKIESNDILAIEYLNAIKKIKSNIVAIPIKRVESTYNQSKATNTSITSATSIRNLYENEKSFKQYVPNFFNLYKFNTWENLKDALLYKIKTLSLLELENIHQVREGLHNKIFDLSKENISFNQLCDKLISKRYTPSSINRILLNILLNIKKTDINKLNLHDKPEYIRILGMNSLGQRLLSKIDNNHKNIILSLKDNQYLTSDIELKASKLYSYFYNFDYKREYRHQIILKENNYE